MHIKARTIVKAVLFALSFCVMHSGLQAQAVWENYRNEIYNYLSRMAQKGLIRFNDLVRPVSRKAIAANLEELQSKTDQLTGVEKQELTFFLKEYGLPSDTLATHTKDLQFFRNDDKGRWRAFTANNKDFAIYADPIVGASLTSWDGKSVTERSIGLQLWGKIGKHFGFQFYGKDITYSGTHVEEYLANNQYTPAPAYTLQNSDTSIHKTKNFSEVRASLSYSWRNGNISVGQDYLLWGYGINGRQVLSDKAPAYPYVRLDYRPFKWLHFNYEHAWLSSDIVDSSRTYGYGNNVYGGKRTIYVPKFMAFHSITVTPTKGLDLSLGESIIYTDRMDIGYLLPVMFFKIYDNIRSNGNNLAGDNGQLFFQASARNLLPKTHFYTTLFVDEIKISKAFDKNKSRNQLGFNVGGSVTDVLIPYLTLNAEYARVNPFVYRNMNPAQNYTNHSLSMGDWMGNNFDRWIVGAQYTPFARVKCLVQYQYIRKGGAGTLDQQYFAEPQPPFLFDPLFKRNEVLLQCSYQWVHNLYLQGSLNLVREKSPATGIRTNYNQLYLGVHYGL